MSRRSIELTTRAGVWDQSGGVCHYCGKTINPFGDFTIDHIVPVFRGGSDDPSNLVAACSTCNSAKGISGAAEYQAQLDKPGLTIEKLRRAMGMTQAQFAAHVGVTATTVYYWERRKFEPKASQLRKIAEMTGTTMDAIDFESHAEPATTEREP